MRASPARRRHVVSRLLSLILITLAAIVAGAGPSVGGDPKIRAKATDQPTSFQVGVTHTQYSADPYHPAAAVGRAEDILRSVAQLQNQHIMGFGAGNPQPAPGTYDWGTLDRRVNLMRRTGGTPVITLCCSPDWMKGGQAGRTDWSKIEVAPTPDHFDDFAELSAAVARRYPDVTRFLVWNELKGFWDTKRNQWNIELYTQLYNKVYRALKAVNPDIQVGGPYIVMESWSSWRAAGRQSELSGSWGSLDQRALDAVSYWLEHAEGADFLAVDGQSATRDKGLIVDELESNEKFVAVTRWLRDRTSLPIWWAEFYPVTNNRWEWAGTAHRAAVAIDALVRVAAAGASTVLIWQPNASSSLASVALWTDVRAADGGVALPLVDLLKSLEQSVQSLDRPEISWNGGVAMISTSRATILLSKTGARVTGQCGSRSVTVAKPVVVAGRC